MHECPHHTSCWVGLPREVHLDLLGMEKSVKKVGTRDVYFMKVCDRKRGGGEGLLGGGGGRLG